MSGWSQNLPIFPIIVPLLAAAAMLLLDDAHRRGRTVIALLATVVQLATAVLLLLRVSTQALSPAQEILVYRLGDLAAPFGIILVVDHLSALMLVLCAILASASLVYSLARWDRIGMHYQPLFQLMLMGLNGAFLTGDIFNLFVFFEVLLAASYGLQLHGSGVARVKSGLAYIVVNLVASLLFLVGAALIYGITGTLNMADLALKESLLAPDDHALFSTGIALLCVVFLIKAAVWPLNFWLVPAYTAASAPVAAMFSIMTKVGIYALLRIGGILAPLGIQLPFSGDWFFLIGLATLLYSIMGIFGEQKLDRLAGYSVIASSGTLLAAMGLGIAGVTAPLLFYLCSSVLVMGAFYLLIEMAERSRVVGADLLAITKEAFDLEEPEDVELSADVVGIAIPGPMAFLGMSFFTCSLIIAGLPPMSGFVAKFSLLIAAINSFSPDVPLSVWMLVVAILLSGLACIITLSRLGMRIFWGTEKLTPPRLQLVEAAPVAALVLVCILMALCAGPVMDYMTATAEKLHDPHAYIEAVISLSDGKSP